MKVIQRARRARRWGALVAAGAILAGASAVAVPTAAYAATCDGAGCNGQDPVVTGCVDGSYTVHTAATDGVTIELRYSPTCHANWARITPGQWGWSFYVENVHGDRANWTAWGSSNAWSDMVNGYVEARACFYNGRCTTFG